MTDVERLFDTAGMRSAAHLELVRGSMTTAATLAHERTLPVAEVLGQVVPSGYLKRGSTVAVHGVGATSFALALVGEAIRKGSFLAVVAPESFGLGACLDFDIPLRRVVQFVLPNDASRWPQAVASIVEGFDVVIIADRHRVSASQARQLTARNRERGSVIVNVGGPAWAEAADMRFDVEASGWSGLGQGYGHLQMREVTVQVAGRRHHGASRGHQLLLPAAGGGVGEIETAPAAVIGHDRFAQEAVSEEVVPKESVRENSAMAAERRVASPREVALSGPAGDQVESEAPRRFAGADIDALLDAIEAKESNEAAAAGSDADDLDATA